MAEYKFLGFQASKEEQLMEERNRKIRGLRTTSEFLRVLIKEEDQKNFDKNIHIGAMNCQKEQ